MPPTDPRGMLRMRLEFSKGLMQNLEDSAVPNGYAPRIENWTPTASGGLRVRQGWANGGTGGPAAPSARGLAYQADYGRFIVVDGVVALGYKVYKTAGVAPSGNLSTVGSTITTAGGVPPVAMAMGQHSLAFGGSELALLYAVDNTGTLVDSGANAVPKNILALAYHHNAFYAGGGKDPSGTSRPSRLFFTDPGDGAVGAWPTDNWIDVGLGAAGLINSLAVFRDELLIGKSDSLWLLAGTPDDTLDLHRLDVGNAVLGNSMCETPYGAVIAGYDAVYLFDGASVQRISRPIEATYNAPGATVGDVAFFDNKVFIAIGTSPTVWVFDFELGGWYTETFPASESPFRLFAYNDPTGIPYLVGGSRGSTTARELTYKQAAVPPTYSSDFLTETFALRTPEYWVDGPEAPAAFRYLDLRLRQRGGDTTKTGLTVQPYVRLTDGTRPVMPAQVIRPKAAAGVFAYSVPLPKMTGMSVQFLVSQALPAGDGALFDIEEAVLSYQPAGFRQK